MRGMLLKRNQSCSVGESSGFSVCKWCVLHETCSYLDRFITQELKYEDNRRNNSENLDYLIQAHSFGRENSVAIDSSGKRVEYPERLRSVAAADEAQLTQARAALRVPVHARLPTAALKLPVKETSQRRIYFKRSS